MKPTNNNLQPYPVWDKTVRIFHWVNVLCVLGLMAIGIAILNAKALGVSTDGKILLKTWHVYFGYVMALNLSWRLIWGFIGSRYARWQAILPWGKAYRSDFRAFVGKQETHFAGHNPIARLMVALLLLLLFVQACTGLVLAGTDVYMLPFGEIIKNWIAVDSTTVQTILPYSKEGVDPAAYEAMRDFRKPIITIHYYGFYTLLVAIILHVLAVVVTEVKERSGLVSAMFTGRKVFPEKPVDWED